MVAQELDERLRSHLKIERTQREGQSIIARNWYIIHAFDAVCPGKRNRNWNNGRWPIHPGRDDFPFFNFEEENDTYLIKRNRSRTWDLNLSVQFFFFFNVFGNPKLMRMQPSSMYIGTWLWDSRKGKNLIIIYKFIYNPLSLHALCLIYFKIHPHL